MGGPVYGLLINMCHHDYPSMADEGEVLTPRWSNIRIQDVHLSGVRGAHLGIINGLPESPIAGLHLRNVTLLATDANAAAVGAPGWDCSSRQKKLFATGDAVDVSPPLGKGCAFLGPTLPPTPPPDTNCHLEQQLSGSACVMGKGFGRFPANASMWTWHGCRGVFTCDGVPNVVCNSNKSAFSVCACDKLR